MPKHVCILGKILKEEELNPSELHARLIRAGYDHSLPAIYKWGAGENDPSGEAVAACAQVLGRPQDDFYEAAEGKEE
ncbi:MAG: hypothetical protein ACYTKD_29965 [Planctomycetota bacterium]|jgi:hypothetical protein